MRNVRLLPIATSLVCGAAQAADIADAAASPQALGSVTITGARPRSGDGASAAQLREADALTAGPALELVPGVVLSRVGARNEQMVQVRGFDLRQVPVFIDGVPVYVPYDGYVDLGRFTSFDLARVQVDKGFSSMLYGANTLGGAINLIGRRPSRPLELDAGLGAGSDAGLRALQSSWGHANLGLRQPQWYAQAGLSSLDSRGHSLPDGFVATRAEDGAQRDNSQSRDLKASLKLGWTPGGKDASEGGDEYSLNLIDQRGTKGTPPYAGTVASINPRYWRWPSWDKQSIYLLSRSHWGAERQHRLTLRAFHDSFKNSLSAYDDASYSTQRRASSFQSFYDDDSHGASAQVDLALADGDWGQQLGLAAHWKRDVHREHNLGEPLRQFADTTQSLALEGTQRLGPSWSLLLGLGQDRRSTQQAQDYNASTRVVSEFTHGGGTVSNGQAALLFQPAQGWQLRASLARKSRFPTIKDRYSYRLGTALPNAELRPERASHAELWAGGQPLPQALPGLRLEAALFRSDISDLIQSVSITSVCGSNACLQAQNIGRARALGGELGLQWQSRSGTWRLDGHYQHLDRDNLSQPALRLTDTPRHQLRAHAAWRALPTLQLHASVKAASMRWSSSDGLQHAAGHAVLDLKAAWQASPQLGLELGVHNAGDRLYALSEGFPEPGRQWFVQGRLSWE